MQRFEGKKLKYLIISGMIFVILCAAAFLPLNKTQQISFQGRKVTVYDDRLEKDPPGNSEILSVTHNSKELKYSYILNKGFTYPYVGADIQLEDSGKFFDCSRFNVLKIRITSSQLSDCKLYLRVFDKKVTRTGNHLTERYLLKELPISSVPVTLSIPLKQFVTPEWWYQKNNITLKDVSPVDFSKVTAFQIESGATAKTGIIDTLAISQISLTRRPNGYAVALPAIFLILLSIYTVLKLKPRKKTDSPIVITYDKKEISSYRDMDAQRISSYLAEHFSEPELSILTMGESLGLSQKKISKVMNDVFKMSFKQYLTSIRIHEAKRLLLETDRLVIDIALAVGFNSISHFNRVFKTSTQVSPLEFRNKKSGQPQDEL